LDVESVLKAIVDQASRLGDCGASIFEFDEAAGVLRLRYTSRPDAFPAEPMQRFDAFLRSSPVPLGEGMAGRAAAARAPVQLADTHQLAAEALYRDFLIAAGIRSLLTLPLVFQDCLLGVFNIARPIPGEFPPHLIELLQSFAGQAAVALHNARQHRETEERNRELAEALEQQTAMAEVLALISRTPTELEPVLFGIAERAGRLVGAVAGAIAIAGGISLQELADANGMTKDQISHLALGELLKIPPRTGNRGC